METNVSVSAGARSSRLSFSLSNPKGKESVSHTILSSHGHLVIDENGIVISHELELGPDGWEQPIPAHFDVAEFIQTYGSLRESIDVLDIGYTNPDGRYEPPASGWQAMAAAS